MISRAGWHRGEADPVRFFLRVYSKEKACQQTSAIAEIYPHLREREVTDHISQTSNWFTLNSTSSSILIYICDRCGNASSGSITGPGERHLLNQLTEITRKHFHVGVIGISNCLIRIVSEGRFNKLEESISRFKGVVRARFIDWVTFHWPINITSSWLFQMMFLKCEIFEK